MKTRIRELTTIERRAVGEKQMLIDWLKEFPTGILSVVADTFDLWQLIEYLKDPEVKELILARDGKLVIRPDSGDPVDITCGVVGSKYVIFEGFDSKEDNLKDWIEESLIEEVQDDTSHGERGAEEHTGYFIAEGKYYEATIHNIQWNRHDKQYYFIDMWDDANITITEQVLQPSDKGVIELLWEIFGGVTNEQGYKVLDSHIGAIYGDAINLERQIAMYTRLEAKGFASTNIVLGIGSFTYQFNTRDTLGFAAKGAWFEVDGKGYNIYKDPVTDDGTKTSLKGLCAVGIDESFEYYVKTECTKEEEKEGLLRTIFKNGKLKNKKTLTEIRAQIQKIQ